MPSTTAKPITNMTTSELVTKLMAIGLDRRIVWKVKGPAPELVELLVIEWGDHWGGWQERVTGRQIGDDREAFRILAAASQSGLIVSPFACCCPKCLTPALRTVHLDLLKRHGIHVSHGYWADCATELRNSILGA